MSPQSLTFGRCTSFDVYERPTVYQPCVSLTYAPTTPAVDAIMAAVAASTGLTLGTDVRGFGNATLMADFMYDNLMTTQVDYAVQFANVAEASKVQYTVWVNTSRIVTYAENGLDDVWRWTGYPGRLLALQKEIDAAIVLTATGSVGGSVPVLDATLAPFRDYESTTFFREGPAITVRVFVPACLCVCLCVCACARVCVCTHATGARRTAWCR